MVQVVHPSITQSSAPSIYMPPTVPRQPGTLETILDRLGGGLAGGIEQGIASGMQSQMRRAVLDKALGMINPNMTALERARVLTSVDPETQKVLQGVFEQEDKQRQAQGLMQALQGITGPAQPGQSNQQLQAQALGGLSPNEAIQVAKMQQQRSLARQASEEKISTPILERNELVREGLIAQEGAIANQKQSILQGDFSGISRDWLADITGIEPLRTASGAVFKTALKENLLGGITQVGARPNQWVEQQIYDMGAKLGRSDEANLSVVSALESDNAIKRKRVETIDQLADQYRREFGTVPANIGKEADKIVRPFAEEQQKKLAYQLQEIHEKFNPRELNKIVKVRPGTPLTVEKAQVFLDKTNGDEKKARTLAKQAGYKWE